MRFIIFVLFILQISLSFAADDARSPVPGLGICSLSTHSDSYGRGIESAFTGEDLRHKFNDETCYRLGFQYAQDAITEFGRNSCEAEFKKAYPLGLESGVWPVGTHCFSLGFIAGRATLGVGAREAQVEVVGLACVDSYQRGVKDGKAGRVSTPGTTRFPESFCYQLGHFEYPLFN